MRASLFSAIVATTLGCSADDSSDGPSDLPPETQGVQFDMKTTIEPGAEVEHCQFVKAPPEGLNIVQDEIVFAEGSHHVLLYSTPYTEIPTKNVRGAEVDTSGVFDCSQGVFEWQVTSIVAGSQNAGGDKSARFPDGVAVKVPGNTVLMMNVHYINAGSAPIHPEVRIKIDTVPDDEVRIEGGLLFWYNPLIFVGANSQGKATMSCPITQDISILSLQSHMHRRGVDYVANLMQPGTAPAPIYQNTQWEGVPVEVWEDGLPVAAGSRIDYTCGYNNTESRDVYQGPRSSDEMCMVIAPYWPVKPDLSLCASDPSDAVGTQSFAAEWTGSGSKTCAETLQCVQKIPQTGDALKGLTHCVLESRPQAKTLVSDAVRCLVTSENPQQACSKEITACLAEPQ